MTVDVRTFKAATMHEALDIVRRELGPDAVILHTKQTDKRRIWPWTRAQQEVEITATSHASVGPLLATAAAPAQSFATSPEQRFRTSEPAADLAPPPPLLAPRKPVNDDSASPPARHDIIPPKWSPTDVIRDLPPVPVGKSPQSTEAPPPRRTSPIRTALPPAQQKTIAARSRLLATSIPPAGKATSVLNGDFSVRDSSWPTASAADVTNIQQRLESLQKMILDLGKDRRGVTLHDVPPELFQLYTTLLDADVDDDLARELVCRAKQHAAKFQLSDAKGTLSLLATLIEQELRIAPPITPKKNRRNVVALVGPTGVGKTTTLAKLAGNFRLREGVKIGLVTVDTFRIAAVDQLRTYAEIIDLPMKVVATPEEMRRAMDELIGLDLVLIDTAGRSPKDDVQILELKAFLEAARVDEVHLVLSLSSSAKSIETAAANFQPLGITALMLTKLDEATGAGTILNIARRLKTPISYVTTGQHVPDDIEPAQKTRLARMVLGLESVIPQLPKPNS